jgi:hypothetical protein
MAHYFRCHHCHQFYRCNIRLKVKQKYCSSKACQQVRKNFWEREKVSTDEDYSNKRKSGKAAWRKRKPAYRYQKAYREMHPGYEKHNKFLQQKRKRAAKALVRDGILSKIVKTDTLSDVNIATWGLYEILPYNFGTRKKIVKTDALIVEIRTYPRVENEVLSNL